MLSLQDSVDIFQLEKNIIKNLINNSHRDPRLLSDIGIAQKEEIEHRVKTRLITRSSRDSNLTSSKNTGIIRKISRNITSGVQTSQVRKDIVSWTGNISLMDKEDPVFNLRPQRLIAHNKVRLWRILEAGTVKKNYPIPRIALLRGSPQLSFFWKRIGKRVRRSQVIHPGIKGRNYFLRNNSFLLEKQIVYETDRKITLRIKNAFRKYIRRVNR